jgi:ubiquinone/menaquinone biosynthesis C-methylase UbiE
MQDERAKKHSRKMFNRIASRYESTMAGRHSDRMKKAALRCLDQNIRGSVLDVGCGPGLLLGTLAAQHPQLYLAGIDIAPEMVKVAQGRLGARADIRLGESESLPWPDASFNYLFCIDSFHHYPNGKKALREFRRVLTHDGHLLLADPTAPFLLRAILNSLIGLMRMGDMQMYDRRKLTSLLQTSGFTSVHWQASGSWGFIASAVAA